jgi:hypothetical protein
MDPQPPQLLVSVSSSTQALPQGVNPGEQLETPGASGASDESNGTLPSPSAPASPPRTSSKAGFASPPGSAAQAMARPTVSRRAPWPPRRVRLTLRLALTSVLRSRAKERDTPSPYDKWSYCQVALPLTGHTRATRKSTAGRVARARCSLGLASPREAATRRVPASARSGRILFQASRSCFAIGASSELSRSKSRPRIFTPRRSAFPTRPSALSMRS